MNGGEPKPDAVYRHKAADRTWYRMEVRAVDAEPGPDDAIDTVWRFEVYNEDAGPGPIYDGHFTGQGDFPPGVDELVEQMAASFVRLAIGWSVDDATRNGGNA